MMVIRDKLTDHLFYLE